MFDLGLDDPASEPSKVEEKIQEVERRFQLVLITELWEQSLVLMQELLCWQTEDLTSLKEHYITITSKARSE